MLTKNYTYKLNSGPFNSIQGLDSDWNEGNCRRAVQYYIWKQKNIFTTNPLQLNESNL